LPSFRIFSNLKYETALKKTGKPDVNLMIYCARAYYISARNSKLADEMKEASIIMEKICKLQPNDLSQQFNLALSLQQYAQLVSEKTEDSRDISELHSASEAIDSAEQYFRSLKDVGSKAVGYDANLAAQREKHCAFIRNAVVRQLSQQRANEELKREKMEEILRIREAEEEKKRKYTEEQERKRLELESKILQTRETLNAQLQLTMAANLEEAAESSKV